MTETCCNNCRCSRQKEKEIPCSSCPVIWGTVYDCCGNPMAGCPVTLVGCADGQNSSPFIISQTCSDCRGQYEIQLPFPCRYRYRIEIGNVDLRRQPSKRQNYICYY